MGEGRTAHRRGSAGTAVGGAEVERMKGRGVGENRREGEEVEGRGDGGKGYREGGRESVQRLEDSAPSAP